ncbi:MAG TPA: PQQ-dependent sugar dehydrogenase [Gemmatimonadales bacterium]
MPRTIVLLLLAVACVQRAPGEGTAADQDSTYVMQRVAGNALVLPAGFAIDVFAERLPSARFMAVGPDSSVFVSLTSQGRVVRLVDGDGDGRAEGMTTVLEHLRNPHGLAFRGDTLYVAEEHRVVRGVSPAFRPIEVVVASLPSSGGHATRTVVFRDDEMLVSVGSSCNLCDERDSRRAAVLSFRSDGSDASVFATGLRNSVGLAVHAVTGEVWATNNDRDRLGDDVPPDRVNILRRGGFYGWPQCYLPLTPNPEYQAQAARCADAIGPAVTLPAHTAPLGLTFYGGTRFPAAYRGNLFVALHGSWDRSFPIGYKVIRIPIDGGRVAGDPIDFISGWQVGRRSWGRPVDVLTAPDGSLLISDDQGGRIYRVSYSAR